MKLVRDKCFSPFHKIIYFKSIYVRGHQVIYIISQINYRKALSVTKVTEIRDF